MNRSDIETTYLSDNCIIFKTTCSCEHGSVTVIIDKLSESENDPLCSLLFTTSYDSERNIDVYDPWYIRLPKIVWSRFITCLKIIFTGRIDCDEEFIFITLYPCKTLGTVLVKIL